MYRTNEAVNIVNKDMERIGVRGGCEEKKRFFSVETLLDLTETIATMAMGAGFLLMVAALLAAL